MNSAKTRIASVILTFLMVFSLLTITATLTVNALAATGGSEFEDSIYPALDAEYTGGDRSAANIAQTVPKLFANGAIRVYPDSSSPSAFEEVTRSESALFSQRSDGPVAGILANAGDIDSYTIEIDHTKVSRPMIFAYPFVTTKDFAFEIRCESNQSFWETETELNTPNFVPKKISFFPAHENDIETYTLSIVALEDATGYAFTLGTLENFADDFGNGHTLPTVPKNNPCTIPGYTTKLPQFFRGYQALLNTGEWFHYRADGETYITAGMAEWADLSFEVYDLDTGACIYETTAQDRLTWNISSGMWDGYVQKRLDLEAGKDYLIRFYSTRPISVPEEKLLSSTYIVWLGLPYVKNQPIDYASAPCRLPANTTRTFTFNVSGFPNSMRASDWTRFAVSGSNSSGAISATDCKITAPNGYTFVAPYGTKSGLNYPVLPNYLKSPSNIPINGPWKVTVSARREIPDLKFRISSYAVVIVGNDGN